MLDSYAFGTTAAVGIVVIAAAFAVSVYSNWSSDAAGNKFTSASVSPDQPNSQGKTGCVQGKRKLPTQILPLP
jgi:hypothetical protein